MKATLTLSSHLKSLVMRKMEQLIFIQKWTKVHGTDSISVILWKQIFL